MRIAIFHAVPVLVVAVFGLGASPVAGQPSETVRIQPRADSVRAPLIQRRFDPSFENDCPKMDITMGCRPTRPTSVYSSRELVNVEANATSRRTGRMTQTTVSACMSLSRDFTRSVSLGIGTTPYSPRRISSAPVGGTGNRDSATKLVRFPGPFAAKDRRCTKVVLTTRTRPEHVYVDALPQGVPPASCGSSLSQCELTPRSAFATTMQR